MNKSNLNILVVISGDEYIRNYIESDSLTSLENNYNCYIICSSKVKNIKEISNKNNFIGFYQENEEQSKNAFEYFNILMYKNRNKSKSFKFRIRRLFDVNNIKLNSKSILSIFRYIYHISKNYLNYFSLIVKSSVIIYWFYKKKYEINYKINSELEKFVSIINPQLIIFPSTAYDPIGNDIVKIGKTKNIKTLFIIDNWDNLSSKSILYEKPNFLTVWSEQCKKHAIVIQGFRNENIHILGSARFNDYFLKRDHFLKSHFKFRYILFVGTAVKFDEIDVIYRLDKIISSNKNFEGIKILYRPHPWRQSDEILSLDNLNNIIIDPQIQTEYYKKNTSTDVQPKLDYYPSLIQNSEFVIGGLTSMLIESLIFRKRYIALAHDDKKNLTSQHNILKNYIHFDGIEHIEAVNICNDLNDLESLMEMAVCKRDQEDFIKCDLQREYFLYKKQNINFRDHLLEIIDKILKNKN
jgi:hypothetical protein